MSEDGAPTPEEVADENRRDRGQCPSHWPDRFIPSCYKCVRAQRQVRLKLDQEDTALPDLAGATISLPDLLALPEPERRWAVGCLASAGSVVTLPSQRKTGKTTFVANLAQSGADSEPFLGWFSTTLSGTIAVVNAEMSDMDYRVVYERLGIRHPERIKILNCRDHGVKLNLLNDAVAEHVVKWLVSNDAEWWFPDPWKNFLAWARVGMNDNDGVNRLAARVQEIHAAAGIQLTVIPMHTTQNPQEEGMERGKGAGELEDSADAMWRYTRVDIRRRNSPRVLAVEGRGNTGLDETTVMWDEATGRLTLGTGNRHDARDREADELVCQAIAGAVITGNPHTTSRLRAAVRGVRAEDIDASAQRLIRQGRVHTETRQGRGGGTLWLLGPGSMS
jgi:hypothetical protein